MQKQPVIDLIIPAYNEEESLPFVLKALPSSLIRNVIVSNNGSTDQTAIVARNLGAIVVDATVRGYGSACLTAMSFIRNDEVHPDIVVFLDGDFSDDPSQMQEIIAPIAAGHAEMVIGSRMSGQIDRGAMTIPQRFGNWLAPALIHLFWGKKFTDLGPFRAIKWETLERLEMQDQNFGWTVEMQIKAAKLKLKTAEVPVRYRRRAAGVSKVSGSLKGAFLAGTIILKCVFKHLFTQ